MKYPISVRAKTRKIVEHPMSTNLNARLSLEVATMFISPFFEVGKSIGMCYFMYDLIKSWVV